MDREVVVSLVALTDTFRYLGDRPYKEVVNLIDQLKHSIRELSYEETTTEEPTTVPDAHSDAIRTGVAE